MILVLLTQSKLKIIKNWHKNNDMLKGSSMKINKINYEELQSTSKQSRVDKIIYITIAILCAVGFLFCIYGAVAAFLN